MDLGSLFLKYPDLLQGSPPLYVDLRRDEGSFTQSYLFLFRFSVSAVTFVPLPDEDPPRSFLSHLWFRQPPKIEKDGYPIPLEVSTHFESVKDVDP